jgi:hypothetical protein
MREQRQILRRTKAASFRRALLASIPFWSLIPMLWIYWDTKVTEKIAAFSLQFFGSSHARSIVNALAWRECSRPRAQAESFFTFYLGVVFSVTFRFKGAQTASPHRKSPSLPAEIHVSDEVECERLRIR